MDLPYNGSSVFSTVTASFEFLDFGGIVRPVRIGADDAQGPVHCHLPVPEGGVVKDLAFLGFFECQESLTDSRDFLFTEFKILIAQVLTLMLPRFCGRFTIWDSGSFLEPPFEVHG